MRPERRFRDLLRLLLDATLHAARDVALQNPEDRQADDEQDESGVGREPQGEARGSLDTRVAQGFQR